MNILLVVLATLILNLSSFAQPPVAWTSTIPLPDDGHIGQKIAPISQGGFVVGAMLGTKLGYSVNFLSQDGDSIWTGSESFTWWGYGIRQVSEWIDGNIEIVISHKISQTVWMPEVVRFDLLGNEVYRREYTPGYNVYASCPFNGEDLILCGRRNDWIWFAQRIDSSRNIVWTQTYPSDYTFPKALSSIETSDGAFLVAGDNGVFGTGKRARAMKMDANGNEIWSRQYDELGEGGIISVDIMPDGNLVMTGKFERSLLITLDSNTGDTVSTRAFQTDASHDLTLNSVAASSDGSFYVAGCLKPASYTPPPQDSISGYVAHLNNIGETMWEEVLFDYGSRTEFNDIRIIENEQLVACGSRNRSAIGSSTTDVFVAKICSESDDAAHVVSITDTPDLGGYRIEHEQGEIDTIIFSNIGDNAIGYVSGNASEYWSVLPGGDGNNGDSIVFTSTTALASGVIDTFWITRPMPTCSILCIAGCRRNTLSTLHGQVNIDEFIGIHNSDGDELHLYTNSESQLLEYEIWASHFLVNTFEQVGSILPNNTPGPNHYIWIGHPGHNCYVLKVKDLSGCIRDYPNLMLSYANMPIKEREPYPIPSSFSLQVNPNPFNPSTTISFDLPIASETTLSVFNMLGQSVYTVDFGRLNAGHHAHQFNAATLPSGVYFSSLQAANTSLTSKMVLMK